MTQVYDLILRGGTVVTPGGQTRTDIGIIGERIAFIGDLAHAAAGEIYGATGLHILPGVIDTQVHFREPGLEHKADLETEARSAALGGVVAVFEMPNTNPSTVTPDLLQDKLNRARGRMDIDHAFYAGATHTNTDLLPEMERMVGCCGVKVFMGASTGDLLVQDDEGVAAVIKAIKRRAAFHSEDEYRLAERRPLARTGDWTSHPEVRDVESAVMSTKRLLRIARAAGKRIHVLHISTAEELDILRDAKDVASVECLPQHLTLAAPECYERLKGYAQMNPPIREARHREALWRAINAGIIDVMGSDHAPHTIEEKARPYPASPSGMPGVQTMVPIMLTHVHDGKLSLQRFVELTSAGPQRVFGLADKGRIAEGYHADFTIVDLAHKQTITAGWSKSKCGWTPFDGFEATGWPVATIVRGGFVMREGEIVKKGGGHPIRFNETLEQMG
ncbi:MAG: dihydroorotase [Hyphomonas sp.]|uniref:dihydroorotase n=1 Tax=Hyphomonas sp. TaxID=87 RepID=UPI0017969556|nr:dihydroorotase [Hyphomonas sp.]MBU3919848.1 dihydroorotase [Alphaproteobacteria bacterium]MBA3067091.1 dihydroorotase [Hyphomonas sp.]MBU4063113.1 dihydroorotase [Alphaproteobacteria bacterium]MBU4164430.1 dihydroorotase [Alphaproteobacteria bacterium]MBU4567596.1 dihydroorotase [Alphaproteobacteria bacterium]